MRYKITVEKLVEYSEIETVYESKSNGTRYYSEFHTDLEGKKRGVDYVVKSYKTGKKLDRKTEIYSQEIKLSSLKALVDAVNKIAL